MASKAKSADKTVANLPVLEGEDPWTADEVAELRSELEAEVTRIREFLQVAEAELADLMSEGADGAGRDPADVGSSNFERDQEMSLNANARDMLEQSELALSRLQEGSYGFCEVCGQPIGKARLEAFPRATMCVTCKQREERR